MKGIRLMLSVAAVIGAATAYSGNAQEIKGVTEKTISIGQSVALSGYQSMYGVPIRAGTETYFNMINDRGGINGRTIKLITEDNGFLTPQALSNVRKMVSSDGIFALINSMGTAQIAAMQSYMLEQQKVPIFGTYGGILDWFNPPKEGLFGLQVLYENQARVLGRWTAKSGHKKILALHIEGATFTRAAQEIEPGYRTASQDGSVELLGIKLPTSDYAPIAIKVAQTKPDALIVMLTEAETLLLTKELENQSIKLPIYAWAPSVTNKVVEVGGKSVDGMNAVAWTLSPTDDNPGLKEYRDALAKYAPAEKPDFVSLFMFGEAKVFAEALSRMKGPITHAELYKALYSLKNYETGIFPPVTFSPERHQGVSSVVQVKISGGKWISGMTVDFTNANW
jgi:ABC-type branched-subunit amino acid transport system substrate-binding protein